MKIEVWSDYVCPFCYIGKKRLEEAISQFPHKDLVEVEMKAFELDPTTSEYNGKSIHEALAAKYGMNIEQAKEANQGVGRQAESVGLTFNFEEMKPTNTFDAHRLAKFANTKGKGSIVSEKLLHAYFTESKLISDQGTLADLAEEAGLDRLHTEEVLKDKNAFANEVRFDEAIAQEIGIRGVPFFVINQKYAISGAQPLETFIRALDKAWQEETTTPVFENLSSDDQSVCTDEGCMIPEKE